MRESILDVGRDTRAATNLWCRVRGAFFVITISLVLSCLARARQWTWTSETVDSSGTFNALAVDDEGNVHAGYLSPKGGGTKYAFRSASTGKWFTMFVDQSNGLVNLALDSQQRPHLCYFPHDTLKYASWDGKKWQIQEIAPGSGVRAFTCGIAVAPDGTPHVTWYQYTDAAGQGYVHIRHAELRKGVWRVRTLDFGQEAGKWNSVRVNSRGRTYVSYSAFRDAALRVASSDREGSWVVTTVEDGRIGRRQQTTTCMGNSMVLDKNGRPSFSYQDETTLRYAWPEGDHWRIDVVDDQSNPSGIISWVRMRTGLALDAEGNPHIVYETEGALKHAWWDGSKWRIQAMGIYGPQFRYPSIAISKDDVIYIGYSDPGNESFKVLIGRPVDSHAAMKRSATGVRP